MEVIFNELAVKEMNDAIAYYELQYSGLGAAFKEEVQKALKRIIAYPDAWPAAEDYIRKYILHKYPYYILYSLVRSVLVIFILSCL